MRMSSLSGAVVLDQANQVLTLENWNWKPSEQQPVSLKARTDERRGPGQEQESHTRGAAGILRQVRDAKGLRCLEWSEPPERPPGNPSDAQPDFHFC